MPGILAIDAAQLCMEADYPGARRLPAGTVGRLLDGRQVVFRAAPADARLLHAEAAGLARHDALVLVPGEGPPALLALWRVTGICWTRRRARGRSGSLVAPWRRRWAVDGGRNNPGRDERSPSLRSEPSMTAEEARVAFLEWLERERRAAPLTARAYGADLTAFLGFLTQHLGG